MPSKAESRQRGAALLIMVLILMMGGLSLLVNRLSAWRAQLHRNQTTTEALATAKAALIGDALTSMTTTSINGAGYLSLPDIGVHFGAANEGFAAGSFLGNNKNLSVIGKLPWKSLDLAPTGLSGQECLWYIVSGTVKKLPKTDAFNWDTRGQIDVIDAAGTTLASNLAALIVAPGAISDGQDRSLADPAFSQCGGNYDARNYLDAYNSADAIAGEVNYFSRGVNNRIAPDSSNKRFVQADNDRYNDRFLFITVSDLFLPMIRTNAFSHQIATLLNDMSAQAGTVAITGSKGTDGLNCMTGISDVNFCINWKEMLLLTQLPSPAAITVDDTMTHLCSRVLIFAGQAQGAQVRLVAADKRSAANYLEDANLAAFAVPIALSGNFVGSSHFSADASGSDLLRCLP